MRPTFKSNRDIGSGNGNDHRLLLIIAGILVLILATAGGIYYYLNRTGQPANVSLPFRSGIFSEAKEKKSDPVLKTGETKDNGIQVDQNKKDGEKKPSAKEAESKPDPGKELKTKPSQAASANGKATVNGITNLKLTSTGRCWLRVTDQKGTVMFEGNLLKGESKSFTSNSDIVMRIGNLKDLRIEHNGKVLPYEEPREAVTRTYTPAAT